MGVSSRVPVERTGTDVVVFGQRCPVRTGATASELGDIDVLLRPEDVAIEVDPAGKGFVTHRTFLGSTTRLTVQVGEIPVRVDVRTDVAADIDLGTHVRPTVVARDVLVAPRVASKDPL